MKYSKQGNKAQPGTADIQAALDKRKADTRKLHAEMQTIIANQHHPSCRQSDKDLVWHCVQCGLNESAEALQDHADKLAEAANANAAAYDAKYDECERLQAQAAQLAEALRGVQWKITVYGSHWEPSQSEREAIATTLAAYEAAQ